MIIENIVESLKKIKADSQKRKFNQTVDFIIVLKNVNVKKSEEQLELFVNLHYKIKDKKICGLVGPELLSQAKEICDKAISVDEFDKLNPKEIKKLAEEFDFFLAQATVMPQLAKVFGKIFAPRSKMPNPKAGCVVPPNANLKPICERLKNTIKILAKTQPVIQTMVGTEDMKDEELADNILTVYNQVVRNLPLEKNNINKLFLKFTMGKPLKINLDGKIISEEKPVEEKVEKEKPVEA